MLRSPTFPRSACIALVALVAALWASACGTDPSGGGGTTAGGADPTTGGTSPDGGAQPGTPGDPNALTLPIEVLGDGSPNAPFVASARLRVAPAALAGVQDLYFECHRCGFYSAPECEVTTAAPTKVKASLRILGGSTDESTPWVDVTDDTVTLADDERVHGGVNGGLFTTRITLALDAATRSRLVALPDVNTVQFRFNGTDGDSNGYRVLDLQLQDGSGKDIGADTRTYVDPNTEKTAGGESPADVEAGRALWYAQGSLKKSAIVARTIGASCSDCHAPDGRDLQYFGYSNNAIVQRSRFHGLSETQGSQIARFLRSTLRAVPHAPKARPWNPPYQPGPGLDGAPATWAAGAGLEAVLQTPADALKALFGKDLAAPLALTQADVDRVMDPHATMNVRETPIPMQLPDWNAWLPPVHPMDVWPDTGAATGSFVKGGVFGNGSKNPYSRMNEVRKWLSAHANPNGKAGDYSHLTADERVQINSLFTYLGWDTYNYLGGGRGAHANPDAAGALWGAQVGAKTLAARAAAGTTTGGPAGAYTDAAFIERATESLLHWLSTTQWALAQEYGLEGNQAWFIGEKDAATGAWKGRGEAHGWPFNSPSTFYLAPHMLYQEEQTPAGKREWRMAWESNVVASYYHTNQWYQLQMTINAGGQSGWSNYPMDWPYLTGFDSLLATTVGDRTPAQVAARTSHNVRLLQGRIKSAQYVDNAIPLDDKNTDVVRNAGRFGRAQTVKHLAPANFMDQSATDRSSYHAFDAAQSGLYMLVVNGAIAQFNGLFAATQAADWRRCDPTNTALGEPEPYAGFRYCLDATMAPLVKDANGVYYMAFGATTTAQANAYGLWKAKQLNAEATRVTTWSAWIDRMW